MKKFALILLAAASLVGTASVATAQWGGYYYGDRYYGDRYRERYSRRTPHGNLAIACANTRRLDDSYWQ
jgi:hypothetical protein